MFLTVEVCERKLIGQTIGPAAAGSVGPVPMPVLCNLLVTLKWGAVARV